MGRGAVWTDERRRSEEGIRRLRAPLRASGLATPSPLAFWARRQAHETAIHRVDAELAHGAVTPFDADFAADGVDELIMGFFGRGTADPVAGPRTLQVVAADAGQQWQATLTPDGARTVSVRRPRDRRRRPAEILARRHARPVELTGKRRPGRPPAWPP